MNKKKRIALLTNNDDDIYCFRKELIEAFLEHGYEVLISCPYGEKFELMQHIEYIYDDPVIDRRGTNVVSDFRLFLHYRKLFKQYRPDVVLTYTAKPNVYGGIAARSLGIPYICNVTGFGSVPNKSGLLKAFIMRLFKASYRHASCIMFQNSINMQIAHDKGMVKGTYKLIPGSGVALGRFPLQPYPETDIVIFNYIGRILKDKGVDDYIAAAKAIKKAYPNTEFNMLGFIEPTEQHYEEDLAQLEKQGIVYYRGQQKDVRPWIIRSHATIHPSTYGEGMSNVLLESAASGRVIITTDNPGCKETVNNGDTGYIYHGGDVNALIEKIKTFLELENTARKEMGLRGREKIQKEFSREIVIQAYLEQIQKLVR